ncbi:MAG: recombinase family protein [Proteobacteria bacterium]|nr:recombinase family protein [Pseudomonadota bacterium]
MRAAFERPGDPSVRRVAIWLRVSTEDQKLDSQKLAVDRYVRARGWQVVNHFHEQGVGGAAQYRKAVGEILDGARRRHFDTVVIFRGDRSFRTAGKGCMFIDELIATGCTFVSIEDGIDTSTPAGELMAKMAILMAEWERKAIRARVRAGLEAARRRGIKLGRPRRAIDVARARKLIKSGQSIRATARELGVPHRTLRRALQRQA